MRAQHSKALLGLGLKVECRKEILGRHCSYESSLGPEINFRKKNKVHSSIIIPVHPRSSHAASSQTTQKGLGEGTIYAWKGGIRFRPPILGRNREMRAVLRRQRNYPLAAGLNINCEDG